MPLQKLDLHLSFKQILKKMKKTLFSRPSNNLDVFIGGAL